MENAAKEIIDLRSDTVTLPTEEMLEAIRHAPLGDDVYREDPTVRKLEEMAAKKMGKEAALLVTSGTQANLVSLMNNTKRGDPFSWRRKRIFTGTKEAAYPGSLDFCPGG